MEKSLFNLGIAGTNRGRVEPASYAAPHGDYIFCLGFQSRNDLVEIEGTHEYPTQVWNDPEHLSKSWTTGEFESPFGLKVGDCQQVFQDIDLTGANLIRVAFNFDVPTALPEGYVWEVSILVDDVKKSRMTMNTVRSRTRCDMAANVSKINGIHKVEFRLALAEG
jgi:hypothetical protein